MTRADRTMQAGRNLTHGRARQRGSAILLVVAALLLSLLMGLAYMSTARQDRRSTRTMAVENDIDQVEQSILDRIRDVLREDVGFDDAAPDFASGGTPDETFAGFFQNRTGGDADRDPFEAWPSQSGESPRPPMDYDGESLDEPGKGTSPWLASKTPLVQDDPTTPDEPDILWKQITRLTDAYVDADGNPDPSSGQHWLDYTNENVTDDGIGIPADATGDGFADSRWERAPVFSLNGVDYYMAVRIVDNSSMINANVAFNHLDSAYDYTADDEMSPRWQHPTEIDLGSLVYRYGSLGGATQADDYMVEMDNFLQWRTDDDELTTRPVDPELGAAWWDLYHGQLRTDNAPQLSLDSEFSLRYRGGLNNRNLESGIESLDDGFMEMLRHYPQADYDDDSRIEEWVWADGFDNMIADGMTPPYGITDDFINYHNMNPRAQLTAMSGATEQYKWDLKTLLDNENVEAIAGVVEDVFETAELLGDTLNTPAIPRGLRDHAYWSNIATDQERLEAFSAQYAVNLLAFSQGGMEEFSDEATDRRDFAMPRYLRDGADDQRHYGMLPLPYVSEVYSQRKYTAAVVEEDEPDDGDITVGWEATGPGGYAIEVRNPHRRPVRLDLVRVRVDGEDWGRLDELLGQDYLFAGETAYLMHHSGDDWTGADHLFGLYPDDTPDDDADHVPGSDEDNIWRMIEGELDASETTPWALLHDGNYVWPEGDQPVNVELFCLVRDVGAGSPDDTDPAVTPETEELTDASEQPWYRYQQANTQTAYPQDRPDVVYVGGLGEINEDDERWHQHMLFGDGRGLNVMTILPGDFVVEADAGDNLHPDNLDNPAHDATLSRLGIVDKTDVGPSGPLVNGEDEQFVFPKTRGMQSVADLTLVSMLSPRGSDATNAEDWTVAGAWQSGGGAYENTSDFEMPWGIDPTTGEVPDGQEEVLHETEHVPYMAVLMDRFTTQRYWDSADDPDAGQFVPGTVNVNTASREVLLSALALPWDDDPSADREDREQTRRAIVDAIIRYRDNLGDPTNNRPVVQTGDPWRQEPGIRYIGELYAATWDIFGDDTADNAEFNGVAVDRLGNPLADPDDLTAGDAPDGVSDDLEERAMVLRMLSELLTTRSDVFTAHILIRGYQSTDQNFVEPLVERRLMGVFDRSPVFDVDTNDRAGRTRLLGVYRY